VAAPRTLVIGNKNYSSWSLRPWLAMKVAGIPFEELRIPLDLPETRAQILRHSPSGKVPVLREGEAVVHESLAICEFLAERFPEAQLWPEVPAARALARSVSAEMHAGFAALRAAMPMNVRARLPGRGRAPGVDADVERIGALWRDARVRFGSGGDFLFGRFSIADAMFAPVVTRFRTYDVPQGADGRAYCEAVWELPAMREWEAAARAESERIEAVEIGEGSR
jgi:glutathione S-transferase